MKKIFFAFVTLCGICVGTHSVQLNSATAQTGTVTTTIIPLTNQAPFVNTVVRSTNLSTIQFSNVVSLLLNLQTNIEETLPVLDLIQSNALVVSVGATNHLGIATPLTNASGLTPTGAASEQRRTLLAVTIGPNSFAIDAPTLQALFILRDNLQQSLTVLQALNGTAPGSTNLPPSLPPSATFLPPPVTNFSPGPLTNRLTVPMSNIPPFVPSNGMSPF